LEFKTEILPTYWHLTVLPACITE